MSPSSRSCGGWEPFYSVKPASIPMEPRRARVGVHCRRLPWTSARGFPARGGMTRGVNYTRTRRELGVYGCNAESVAGEWGLTA